MKNKTEGALPLLLIQVLYIQYYYMQKKNIFLLILITATLIILSSWIQQPVITGISAVVTAAAILFVGKDLFSKKVD